MTSADPTASPIPGATSSAAPAAALPERVFLVVNDLFFEAKIGEVLRTLGVPFLVAKSEAGLAKRLLEGRPALAFVDMGARGLDAAGAVRTLRAAAESAPIVAFLSHIQPEDAKLAKAAGATEAMPKSRLKDEIAFIAKRHAGHLTTAPLAAVPPPAAAPLATAPVAPPHAEGDPPPPPQAPPPG